MKVGGLEIELLANVARLSADMDKAQRVVGGSMARIENIVSRTMGLLGGLGAGLSLGGLVALVQRANDAVDALNDVKDATGASIENISALQDIARRTGTSVDTVSGALVKFNKELRDSKPNQGADLVLKSIGLSAEQLKRVDPAKALHLTSVALSQFADDGNKAYAVQMLFGKSTKEVAAFLKDLSDESVLNAKTTTAQAEEAEKFNKQLLALRTNISDTAVAISTELVPALNSMFEQVKKNGLLNTIMANAGLDQFSRQRKDLELLNISVTEAASKYETFLDAQKKDPYNPAYAERVRFFRGELKRLQAQALGASDALKQAATGLKPLTSGRPANEGGGGFNLPTVGDLAAAEAAAEAAAKRRAEAERAAAAAQRDRLRESARAAEAARRAEEDAVEAGIEMHQQYRDAILAAKQAQADEYRQAAIAADEAVTAAQREFDLYGKSKSQIAEVTLLTLKSSRAKLQDGTIGAQSLETQIDAQERLIEILRKGEARDAATEAAKAAADEWQKTADSINQSLTDALLRGFESGKGFAKNLRDTLINMFQTLVLRPQISAVLGLTGASGSAMASGGGGLGGLGGLSQLGSLFGGNGVGAMISNLGSEVGGFLMRNGFGSLGSGINSALYGAGGVSNIAYGGAGILGGLAGGLFGGQGSLGGSLGSTLGLALSGGNPLFAGLGALAGGAIGSLFGNKTPYNKGGNYFAGADGTGKRISDRSLYQLLPGLGKPGYQDFTKRDSSEFDAASKTLAEGLQTTLGTLLETFGKESEDIFVAFRANGKKSLGQVNIGGVLTNYSTKENDPGKGFEAFTSAASRALLTALDKADIPAWASKLLEDVKDAPGLEALQTVATQIAAVQQLTKTLQGLPLINLKTITEESSMALAELAGGIDQLQSSINQYYADFYSEEERTAATISQLTATLASLGVAMPASRDAFRDLVESINPNTEAGRKLYSQLIALAPAFASVVGATQQTTQALNDQAAAAQRQAEGWAQYADERAAADQRIRDSWRQVSDSLVAEALRIRGLLGGSTAQTYASAQSDFAVTTAQARAGDIEAAKRLPGLSQNLLDLAVQTVGTSEDLARVRALTAASLDLTSAGISAGNGVATIAQTRVAGPIGGTDVVSALRDVQAELAAMRTASETTAAATAKTASTLVRATRDGDGFVVAPP